jgi:uncharacterized protein YdeI (YjbR/CyaY-like superfamily)
MAPGSRREDCDRITEAKREQTRATRVATSVEWISQGKRHIWKYES